MNNGRKDAKAQRTHMTALYFEFLRAFAPLRLNFLP